MNKQQQIKKAPKFMVFIDTSANEKFKPSKEMIKRERGYGLSPCYYAELEARDVVSAIVEADSYKQEGVYLVDILERLNECDKYGYVKYRHLLRSRIEGFYPYSKEDKEGWFNEYNPEFKSVV